MQSAGVKGAATRKRRAVAKTTAARKVRGAAGAKAATPKKRTAVDKNTAATKKGRAAATTAAAGRRLQSRDDIDQLIYRAASKPLSYDFPAECTSLRVVRRHEGGVVYSGLRFGRPVLVQDEGTLADMAPEIGDECVTILEFRTISDRSKYLGKSRLYASRRRTV